LSLLLASASPRRYELLRSLGIPFQAVPVDVDEGLRPGASTAASVMRLAVAKATAAAERWPLAVVLAADTLVSLKGVPLGKPADAGEARAMLQALRANEHEVVTGLCVISLSTQPIGEKTGRLQPQTRVVRTAVRMQSYSDEEIERSIERGTPFDKAGAYAIQDEELAPVASIDGCRCNVLGLPLWTVVEMLAATDAAVHVGTPERMPPECATCPLNPLTSNRSPA
jgi:septum formation protein